MRHFPPRYLLLSLMLLLLSPVGARAIPAITCHCFTDRTYNPAQPFVADPYFLATTQNSFFAEVFAVEKKSIVMKKQKGTSPDDLWVAYWVATRAGVTPEALLLAGQKQGWPAVVPALGLPAKKLGTRFNAALKAKATTPQLAEAVVDELFARYKLLGETELTVLRKAGATNQELILVTLIAGKSRQPAAQLYREVKGGGTTSWGAQLAKAGIEPTAIQPEIKLLLKSSR